MQVVCCFRFGTKFAAFYSVSDLERSFNPWNTGVGLWLKFRSALNLNKIERFSTETIQVTFFVRCCREPEKGKPLERVGRKATGLNPLETEGMVAGLPGVSIQTVLFTVCPASWYSELPVAFPPAMIHVDRLS